MDKEERYRQLIAGRKSCDLCSGCLDNASKIAGGDFDCDEIGPYTQWQRNLYADLMVVGQDFADVEGFIANEGWPGNDVQTNKVLTSLVAEAGIKISLPVYGQSEYRLFFTNAVLCMKRDGGMRGRVPGQCVRQCGRHFLRPTIELVEPKLVVTLGRAATCAVNSVFDPSPPGRLPTGGGGGGALHPTRLFASTWLVPVFHPMASRSREAQREDWRQIGRILMRDQSCAGFQTTTMTSDQAMNVSSLPETWFANRPDPASSGSARCSPA